MGLRGWRVAVLTLVVALFMLLLLLRSTGDRAAFPPATPEWTQQLIKADGRRRCLARLGDRLVSRIRSLIVPGRPVVYVDPPLHWNLGDSFIWEGTIRALDRLGVMPDVICTFYSGSPRGNATKCDVDQLEKLLADGGTVLFQGGGNFGDLYYELQEFRANVPSRLPHARIVFLPNDFHYLNRNVALSDMRKLAQHPDVHLIFRNTMSIDKVRDIISALAAEDASLGSLADRVYLEPDAAFVLGDLELSSAGSCSEGPTHDLVLLIRGDGEQTREVAKSIETTHAYLDSLTTQGYSYLWLDWFDLKNEHVRLPLVRPGGNDHFLYDWRTTAAVRTEMGRSILCHGKAIVTDRMHAFILGGLLMGKPIVYMDNTYGKTTAIIDTWIATGSPEGCRPEYFTFTKAIDTAEEGPLLAAVKQSFGLTQLGPYDPPL